MNNTEWDITDGESSDDEDDDANVNIVAAAAVAALTVTKNEGNIPSLQTNNPYPTTQNSSANIYQAWQHLLLKSLPNAIQHILCTC
jgi:hypothetical protein